MALIEWNDDLKIGIEEVDSQHHILVRAINLLDMGIQRNCSDQLMSDIFATLNDYTQTHFADEEKLFDAAGYEDAEAHKETHANLLRKFGQLKDDWASGKITDGQKVLDFLVVWLSDHILKTDVDYLESVNAYQNKLKEAS